MWQEYFELEPGTLNTNNQLAMIGSLLTGKDARKHFKDFGGVTSRRQYTDGQIEAMWKAYFGNQSQNRD